jgi:hypothetical protein
MTCAQCRQPLPEGATQCENCGARVVVAPTVLPNSPRSKAAARALMFVSFVVVVNIAFGGAQFVLDGQGALATSVLVWAIGRVVAGVLIYFALVNGYRGRAESKAGYAGGGQAVASIFFGWILAVLWIVSVVTTLILMLGA